MSKKNLEQYLENPNVQAFLGLIRDTEGTAKGADPYRVYGGSANNQMESLDSPNFKKWSFTQTDGKKNSSTASGAYQFLERTWNNVAKEHDLTDFSPHSQDLGAVALLQQNGALPYILNGDFDKAVQKSNKTWASLPGSPYSQHTRSMEYVNNSLQKHLGQPIDLSRYEGGDNPKTQAPKQSTSQEASVQKTETASNQPSKPQQTNKSQVVQETVKETNKVISLLMKVWRLFRKQSHN